MSSNGLVGESSKANEVRRGGGLPRLSESERTAAPGSPAEEERIDLNILTKKRKILETHGDPWEK